GEQVGPSSPPRAKVPRRLPIARPNGRGGWHGSVAGAPGDEGRADGRKRRTHRERGRVRLGVSQATEGQAGRSVQGRLGAPARPTAAGNGPVLPRAVHAPVQRVAAALLRRPGGAKE